MPRIYAKILVEFYQQFQLEQLLIFVCYGGIQPPPHTRNSSPAKLQIIAGDE